MSKKDDKRRKPADTEVGYGRPPKATQFQKGQSGNDRGRPRKSDTAKVPSDHWGISLRGPDTIFYEPVNATINGKQRPIPAIEAVHRRRINDAIKGGNRLLQRDVIARADAHEQELLRWEVERFLQLKEKKTEGEALIAQAKARGLPEPELLPHPDDIIIDEETTTATIDGPATRDDLAVFNFMLAVREHYVIRAAYQRQFPPLLRPFTERDFEALKIGAESMNDALCTRLRWGPPGFWAAMRLYEKKGYRFLEADLENSLETVARAWANESALDTLRESKHVAKFMIKLLAFKTRKRERTIWQRWYNQIREVLGMALGEAAVATWPKRYPTRSYAETMEIAARLSPEARARGEAFVEMLTQTGPVATPG